jgi:hypothetical protein
MATNQNDYDGCPSLSEEGFRIATEVRDVEAAAWSLVLRAMPFGMQVIPQQPPSLSNQPSRWPGLCV